MGTMVATVCYVILTTWNWDSWGKTTSSVLLPCRSRESLPVGYFKFLPGESDLHMH
ncbi:MAG: hypothetical protein JW971_04550 [Synergistales bacterium]|nr:hypothetical protein [Synergistales bacterium]